MSAKVASVGLTRLAARVSGKPTLWRGAQLSDEWKKLHRGRPTASNFHKILTAGGKESRQRRAYMCRLIAERLMNEFLPDRAMTERAAYWLDRGIAMEPIAVQAFQREAQLPFEPVGFVISPHGGEYAPGCSPDGLIAGADQAVEIKSPAPWTQVEYLLDGPGTDYKPQVQGQMIVGEFECVHFYSFHPRMPPKYIITLPDVKYSATLRQALADFIGELDEDTEKARALGKFIPVEEILAMEAAAAE
jgi:hypothetical protein